MARFSMSALSRVNICPASAALPGVDQDNAWSAAGRITHRYLQRVPQIGKEAALADAPEDHRARLACIELDPLPLGPEFKQEVAYAYDVTTGKARLLGDGMERDYSSVTATEIPGTADVDGPGSIDDYKTDHGHDELAPPPRENLQILGLSLAKARTEGLSEIAARVIRVADDGQSRFETATFDFFDLEDTAVAIARIFYSVEAAAAQVARGEMPSVRESKYCRYCPAVMSCPAKTALVRQLAWTPDDVKQEVFAMLTPAQAQRAHAAWRAIGRAYGEITGQLRKYAEEIGPIDLGDGTAWGLVPKQKESINGRVAFDVLRERYGEGVAAAAVDIKATKSGLEEALREVKASSGVPLAQLKREALKAISEHGGITIEEKSEFDTYKKESGT